jgi:transcriptional regulator with GAF, ATPase, and Fis domain
MTGIDHSQATAFARISRELLSEPDRDHTLQRSVDMAVATISGCEQAGISLRHADGRIETPASTSPVVDAADAHQYELHQGPCLDAIWVDDTYLIQDMTTETRWPAWAPRAAALGIRSVLSVRLATPDRVIGGLNLYSTRPAAYDEDGVETAHIYAAHASMALATIGRIDGLRTAMQSRHLLGVAQGALMHRYGVSEAQSFEILRRFADQTGISIRDVAAQVVSNRGGF